MHFQFQRSFVRDAQNLPSPPISTPLTIWNATVWNCINICSPLGISTCELRFKGLPNLIIFESFPSNIYLILSRCNVLARSDIHLLQEGTTASVHDLSNSYFFSCDETVGRKSVEELWQTFLMCQMCQKWSVRVRSGFTCEILPKVSVQKAVFGACHQAATKGCLSGLTPNTRRWYVNSVHRVNLAFVHIFKSYGTTQSSNRRDSGPPPSAAMPPFLPFSSQIFYQYLPCRRHVCCRLLFWLRAVPSSGSIA